MDMIETFRIGGNCCGPGIILSVDVTTWRRNNRRRLTEWPNILLLYVPISKRTTVYNVHPYPRVDCFAELNKLMETFEWLIVVFSVKWCNFRGSINCFSLQLVCWQNGIIVITQMCQSRRIQYIYWDWSWSGMEKARSRHHTLTYLTFFASLFVACSLS